LPVPVLAMELARDRLSKREIHHATLLAKIYDPEGGVRAGYLDEVVAPDAVIARAQEEAARLAAFGKMPYRATKERLRGKTIAFIRDSLASDLASLMPT
jgi:enoyl-CoA hydratase